MAEAGLFLLYAGLQKRESFLGSPKAMHFVSSKGDEALFAFNKSASVLEMIDRHKVNPGMRF